MSAPTRYTAPTMQRKRRRWDTGKRWLAAVLTVLAAFAFPVRGPLMARAPEVVAPELHAAPTLSSTHMQHAAQPHPSTPPDHPQNHQGHCLFCLTGAFALEADTATPPPVPVVHLTPVAPFAVHARAATLRHADARAPPHRAST